MNNLVCAFISFLQQKHEAVNIPPSIKYLLLMQFKSKEKNKRQNIQHVLCQQNSDANNLLIEQLNIELQ